MAALGRPPKPRDELLVQPYLRVGLTRKQHRHVMEKGGSAWVRELIAAAMNSEAGAK